MSTVPVLSKEQLSAVDFLQGAALIDAGPGSGKTRVITARTARLLERKIPSGRILALSFTNKAAQELATRVTEMTGANVKISTFHKWTMNSLKEAGIKYSLFDPKDQAAWYSKELGFEAKDGKPHKTVRRMMTIIDKAKNSGFVTPTLWESSDFAKKLTEPERDNVEEVWHKYQNYCDKHGKVDLTDILVLFYRSWKQEVEKGRGKLINAAARIDHLMVDEFQDTNNLQMKLINLWTDVQEKSNWVNERGFPTSFVVCGDVDQSIYGFRGSEPKIFLEFPKRYKDSKVFLLWDNHRNQKKIVEHSMEVIGNNVERTLKQIKPTRAAGLTPCIYGAESQTDEISWVLNQIEELKESGSYEICIMARENELLKGYRDALNNAGVSTRGENFLVLPEIEIVRNLLKIGVVLKNDWIAKSIPESLAPNLRKAYVVAKRENISLFDALASDDEMSNWVMTVRRISAHIEEKSYDNALSEAFSFNNFFQNAFLHAKDDHISFTRVEKMLRLIQKAGRNDLKSSRLPINDMLKMLANERNVNTPIDLITMHGSKGGEWDHVFMVGLNAEIFPGDEFDTLEEERRVFYVGTTRARETLHFSGLKYNMCPFVGELHPDVRWITKE